MGASIRDCTFQLRQGHLLALADEAGWSLAADPLHTDAVSQLLRWQSLLPPGQRPTMLIQDAGQLSLYVSKPPDIAYDLVDFAEKPLTVIFDEGKNISPVLLDQSPSIAVRKSLRADVQRLIGSLGRGLLTLPLETLTWPAALGQTVAYTYGNLPNQLQKPRIMQLGTGSTVSFLRK